MSSEFFRACLEDQPNILSQCLTSNPELINSKDKDADNRTALHLGASVGSLSCTQILLSYHPDLEAEDGLGFTALIVAASAGKIDVVRELIGAGAKVQAANSRGATALHYAASKSWVDIGKLLVQRGADINARDRANQLPLHRASSVGSTAFLQILLRPQTIIENDPPKPRLNLQDRAGNTPLHLAIESGHGEAAVMLIEAGADRHRTNTDGQRPEELNDITGSESRKLRSFIESRVLVVSCRSSASLNVVTAES